MAYGYYDMPVVPYFNCPYMMRHEPDQNIDASDESGDGVKKAGDAMIPYDASQYRILPLLTIPLLFAAAAGPRPIFYPGPFWPQPFSYYYWYYYR